MAIPWHKNVRFYVLVSSLALAAAVWWRTWASTADSSVLLIRLTQYYALLALTYIYLALLIGPAVYSFHWLPWRGHIYRARRAVGFSAFIFAQLHSELALWGELGGIRGLPYLPAKYLLAITLSSIALLILTLMAATSFDKAVQYLGIKRWKLLHRFVYLAGFLVLIHALLIGSDFQDLHRSLARSFFAALAFLLALEANRFDAYLARRLVWPRKRPITLTVLVVLVAIYYGWLFLG